MASNNKNLLHNAVQTMLLEEKEEVLKELRKDSLVLKDNLDRIKLLIEGTSCVYSTIKENEERIKTIDDLLKDN